MVTDTAVLIDIKKALILFDDDEELLQEIFAVFIEEAPQRAQVLTCALQEQDLKKLNYHAHSLKGVSATIHAKLLSELAFCLEKAASNDELNECERLLPRVLEVLNDVSKYLQHNK